MRRALALAGVLLALLVVAAWPPVAAAQEHAPATEHAAAPSGAEHADTWLGLPRPVFLILNLIVFFAILVRFAGPALSAFLGDKKREIGHALTDAERQRQEAAGMEARLAAQIAELRREVEELAERSAREAERERHEILAEAERERERLETSTRAEIAQGLLQAQQRLTAHAAALATRLAEERLAAGLTREDRRRLFRDNLRRLESHSG